jgi:hypothetical protein
MQSTTPIPKRRRKLSERAVRDALTKSAGDISEAGRLLGVPRSSIHYWVESRPVIRQLVEDQREALADAAESAVAAAVEAGKPWAIKLVLLRTRQGRARGYGNAQHVEIAGGITVPHKADSEASEAVSAMARWLERQGISTGDVVEVGAGE